MQARPRGLLEALLRYPPSAGENRLTELFAVVVGSHDRLARLLFERAGIDLPEGPVEFRAFTQREVAPECIPDMRVSAFTNGHLRAQLWSEHKTSSELGDMQLEKYLDALRSRRVESRALIAIVGNRDPAQERPDWKVLTWQEVAELANRAGRDSDGPRWREAAVEPTAPARERLLHEFIWYPESEGYAVVHALNSDNLVALQKSRETMLALEALLQQTSEHLKDQYERSDLGSYSDGSLYYVLFQVPHESWPARLRAATWRADLEITAAGDDGWCEAGTGEPALGAGITFDEELYEWLAAEGDWVVGLRAKGLGLMPYDGFTRIYRTWPLQEFLASGTTLEEQAQVLADWARESFNVALDHEPEEGLQIPKRSRRSRRKTPGDNGELFTQPVTAADIRNSRIRVPQDDSKGLFPSEGGEVFISLRGARLRARWDPGYGRRGGSGEKSGRLRVPRETLEATVQPRERLRLSGDGDAVRLD